MAFTLVTTQTILARNAGALYNLELGSTAMTSLVTAAGSTTTSIDTFLNTVYTNSVGTASTTVVATELVTNLGITGAAAITIATDFIVGQLNAVAFTARGAVVNTIITLFSGLTTNATFGTFATAYNTKVANAEAYAAVSTNTSNASFSAVTSTATGSTFTLTTGIDSFTGTSGNDTFVGDAGSAGLADTLVGGAGTDTLQLFGAAAKPNFSGIETVFLSGNTAGFDVSDKADVTLLDLVDPTTGLIYTTTTGQAVKLATMAAAEAITFAGNTPTSLAMTLNSVAASGADVTIALTGTKLTSLAITTATAASQVTLTNAGAVLASVTVAGDKALELGSALTTITTINASASTGGVDIDAVGASALAFTGGSGNDRIDLGATLGTTDAIVGGTGTDTIALSGAASATLTSTTGAKISGFEVLEIGETADNTTYNVDNLIGTNTLTGVKLTVTGAGATTTVSNINAAATGNITFTGDEPEAVLTAKDFVAGGTSDTATINLNNDTSDNANGVDLVALTFASADVLNFVTTKSDTAGLQVNSVALTATDAEKITVTGNDSFSVTTSAGTVVTEIDASGMTSTAALTAITTASAQTSLLVKGTANVDTLTLNNAATLTTTLFTGGGSDVLTLQGAATSVNTLKFTTTALNAGDVKAGNAMTIDLTTNGAAGAQVILDFGSTFEGLLKIGGTVLGTSAGNVNAIAALGVTTNVGVTATSATVSTFQIDLDGDGAYTAANDFQITITGTAGGVDTFIYNATNDNFVFTSV